MSPVIVVAVAGCMARRHTSGWVRREGLPLAAHRPVDDAGRHDLAAVCHRRRHECHLQRCGLGVALTEAGDGQQRDVVDEVSTVPNTDSAGRGRSNGGALLKPNASAVATIVGAPMLTAISANAVLQLRRKTSTKLPPQVVP